MSHNQEFQQGHTPQCEQCGGPMDHIHISEETRQHMLDISNAAFMHAQMEDHMRTASTSLKDRDSLAAHLASAGHWAALYGNEDIHTLRKMHDEDHASMDSGPADEREEYTTLGNDHFHH